MKVTKYIMWALIAVAVALAVWVFNSVSTITSPSGEYPCVNALLYYAYALVGIGVAAIAGFGLGYAAVSNPKSLLKILGVLVGIVVLVAVSYVLASGEPITIVGGKQPSLEEIKFTETILNLTYIVFGVAFASIIFGIVMNLVRK